MPHIWIHCNGLSRSSWLVKSKQIQGAIFLHQGKQDLCYLQNPQEESVCACVSITTSCLNWNLLRCLNATVTYGARKAYG